MVTVGGQSREGGAVLVTPGGTAVGSADVEGEKKRRRKRRSSRSRQRAAEAAAKAAALKKIEEEQKRKEASLKLQQKIEAEAKQKKLATTTFKSQLEKIKEKLVQSKEASLFKGAFKKGISKQRKFLTKAEKDVKFGIKPTKIGKKVARRYVAVSPTTNRIIKTNPKILNILVNQQKLTDRTLKELRLGGLGVAQTFVDFVEFTPEVAKFLTVNNPAWNKKTRSTISNAIVTYTPKIWNWGKDIATDSEKRKIAAAAVVAFGANQLKLVKLSPGRALGRLGGEWILFAASGGAWRAAKAVDSKATRGLLKVGNKWIKGNDVLNAVAKKGSQAAKGVGKVTDELVIKTVKKLKKTKRKISNIKIIREIKKIQSKSKVKLTTKQKSIISKKLRAGKFTAIERRKIKAELAKMERKIKGVKVPKKEFKSFVAAQKEFDKLKKLKKFANKIESKGGTGISQKVSKSAISTSERDLLNTFNQIPLSLRSKAEKLSFTTFSQKFVTEVPILKRFGGIKKGVWRVVFQKKTFFQNTVSISMFNKVGKGLGTFSWNTISNKPIQRFRSITGALKWGRGKSVSISRQVGKDFVQTLVLKSRRGKVSQSEFLSKVKLIKKDGITDIEIFTRTATGVPVSRTRGKIFKRIQKRKSRVKNGVLELIDSPKDIERLNLKTIVNPVIIDTSRIDKIVKTLNKVKVKSLSITKKKMVKSAQKRLRKAIRSGRVKVKGKNKIIISKSKIQGLEKIVKELKQSVSLKESLSAASIPKKIIIPKKIEGLTDLKKLIRAEKILKKARVSKLISKGEKSILTSLILSLNKAKAKSKALSKASTQSQKNKLIESLVNLSSNISKKANSTTAKTAKLAVMKISNIVPVSFARVRLPKIEKAKKPKKITLKKKLTFEYRTLKKPVLTFKVTAKRRGRMVTLLKDLTQADAKNFLSYELDNQLLRTARITPRGKRKRVIKLPSKYSGHFNRNKKKLRGFRTEKGAKKRIAGYIEKKKFVGDTKGEIRQLIFSRKRKK